jgi:hypothetical protein
MPEQMTETMREARARYFAENKFGADGGYASKWVDFKLGSLPMPFPNSPARVRAVKFHDLHHLITGYRTDLVGEFEISGWEIGAGCHTFAAAWFLNLSGLGGGLFLCPRKVFRAFRRGLASRTLYPLEFEPLLDRTVEELRAQTGVDGKIPDATVKSTALFVLAALTGLSLGLVTMAFALTPVALLAWIVSYQVWRRSQLTLS